ncbi:WYL domain-containing protein [Streptomyces sp. DT2A-34]|uniref:WYL domain-containing protein n=1 Tax=Streptomyces sp. DT2A-34 TaxID=3051182 RepID=UPI00265C4EAE|nr:WYL domain-containing protein [Streptomyces sp. DT2A-34]MDO0909995.1 WYL domain-containing protein [Streptomyces sp. DT2A-34]
MRLGRVALGEALSQARLKLVASLPASGRAVTQAAAARFHIDSQVWFRPPGLVPDLAELVDAVRGERGGCGVARAMRDPEPDRHRLVLHFDSPTAVTRRLLGFGPDVEVLEPPEVRTRLAETAERTAARQRPPVS